jgi:uncharacterized membrane protein
MEFLKRYTRQTATILVSAILASSSMALYIGRDLRWNSWSVLTNPGGIAFDITNRFIHISDYPSALATSAMFFAVIGSMYFIAISGIRVFKKERI